MRTKYLLYSVLIIFTLLLVAGIGRAVASHTPDPTSVTVAGSLQSELGCPGDWQPDCAVSHLTYDTVADLWHGKFTLPAGSYEYKVAINDSWAENYGAGGAPNGSNITLNIGAATDVIFIYDHKTHVIVDSVNLLIATVPGSYQNEIGCSGDWQPDCLRSWLQDPDGDGTYSFSTTAIPAGNYEAKVAIDESWAENYGAGGVQNGPNIPFTVIGPGDKVTFSYAPVTHVLTITVVSPGPQPDNNVWWDGLKHDSRDLLYRTPGGAVKAGTAVKLRFRTYHNDVTGVKVRLWDLNQNAQQILPMQLAASDVSCYEDGLSYTCDFWEVTLNYQSPDNLWYRFIITDGMDTDYYADNTPALDGGLGATTDDVVDNSYALMFYDPSFVSPEWASGAVIYQIFADRFRNGRDSNNPKTGDIRYDDPVLALPWGTLPEGYCRKYGDYTTNCPWRFDDTPPSWSPTVEGPRGRDYMGGDLKGVDQYLDYLKALGVNTIYFNPIFDAGSNHGYDTQDYFKIDPYFGTQKDWENLVKHAQQRGMKIILDGVFNHMSSDSPIFDRYGHYTTVGACESVTSTYRSWFYFHEVTAGMGACAGTAGPKSADYDGWFGFDTIPVLNKSLPAVQQYFLTNANSVSKYWLNQGAAGWRLDVSGDPSFPNGYWETFRQATKGTNPDSLLISETWQKDSTLLRILRGDRLDTTMNYRLRDAIVGLLTPGPFDSKGFADSGRIISPTEFASRLESIREDYPDAAYYSLMNLVDSHDTERILWSLTPGSETTAGKELNAANLAAGKQRQKIASLIQFTMPGAPTVYYGDEVAQTGDDDPDNRRTYPWADLGGSPDMAMYSHYQALATLRKNNPALVSGDFEILLADDAAGVVAYGRKTGSQAAVVIINRSLIDSWSGTIPVSGYLPDGVTFQRAYEIGTGGSSSANVTGGGLSITAGVNSALLLVTGKIDLTPPAAPAGLGISNEGDGQVNLQWNAVTGAAGYNLYRSPLSGGGWVKVNSSPLTGTTYTDTGLPNGKDVYYVVTALDAAGNESSNSGEVKGMPHYTIGWANVQWPPSINHTISALNRTENVYGQVWINGVTNMPGQSPTLQAQLGYGPDGSNPAGNSAWIWVDAVFNVDAGNNDEFKASLLPETTGTFDYAYRYTTTNGRDWLYADLDGTNNGYSPDQAGNLTVVSSGDTTAPAIPVGLFVKSASTTSIDLAWDAVTGDLTLYGYEVLRSTTSGGPYTPLALVSNASYSDTAVSEGATYYYVVRSIDLSFNRSYTSAEVSATANLRTVSVIFNVTVPATTDGIGRSVTIAGTLSKLDGGLSDWDPSKVVLTRTDATHWTITLTGKENTQIEYKYALGDWNYVEKDSSCVEIANRTLTLSYGSNGTQTVNDTVVNWRNVSPCGN